MEEDRPSMESGQDPSLQAYEQGLKGFRIGSLAIPAPPVYCPGAGLTYSIALARRSQRLSLVLLVIGWPVVAMSGIFGLCATVYGTSTSSGEAESTARLLQVLEEHPGFVCGFLAVLGLGLGWQLIDRAAAATRLASVATQAMSLFSNPKELELDPDRMAYKICIDAKAAWLLGRMNTDRLEMITTRLSDNYRPGIDAADTTSITRGNGAVIPYPPEPTKPSGKPAAKKASAKAEKSSS